MPQPEFIRGLVESLALREMGQKVVVGRLAADQRRHILGGHNPSEVN